MAAITNHTTLAQLLKPEEKQPFWRTQEGKKLVKVVGITALFIIAAAGAITGLSLAYPEAMMKVAIGAALIGTLAFMVGGTLLFGFARGGH